MGDRWAMGMAPLAVGRRNRERGQCSTVAFWTNTGALASEMKDGALLGDLVRGFRASACRLAEGGRGALLHFPLLLDEMPLVWKRVGGKGFLELRPRNLGRGRVGGAYA